MKSHEDRVERISSQAAKLLKRAPSSDKIQNEIQTFAERWGKTFDKISKFFSFSFDNFFFFTAFH